MLQKLNSIINTLNCMKDGLEFLDEDSLEAMYRNFDLVIDGLEDIMYHLEDEMEE